MGRGGWEAEVGDGAGVVISYFVECVHVPSPVSRIADLLLVTS